MLLGLFHICIPYFHWECCIRNTSDWHFRLWRHCVYVQLTLFSVLLEGLEQTDLAHLAHLSGGLGRGHPLVTAQVAEQIFRNLFQETIFFILFKWCSYRTSRLSWSEYTVQYLKNLVKLEFFFFEIQMLQ